MESINFIAYIKPELFIIAVIIYILGEVFKKTLLIKDKFIPVVLMVLAVFFCLLWTLSTTTYITSTALFGAVLEAFIQGILIAACAVYGNQVVKQLNKKE